MLEFALIDTLADTEGGAKWTATEPGHAAAACTHPDTCVGFWFALIDTHADTEGGVKWTATGAGHAAAACTHSDMCVGFCAEF